MTYWKPDTCNCAFEVADWDNSIATTVHNCPFHQGMTNNIHFQNVYHGENKLKNEVISETQKIIPTLLETAPDTVKKQIDFDVSGNALVTDVITPGETKLRDGVEHVWSFDQDRKLHITIQGISKSEETAIEAGLQAKFQNVKFVKNG